MMLPKFLKLLQSFSTLQIALTLSIAFHAVLLTVRFVDPEAFNRVFEDTPLEVILVNTQSDVRPDKAQAIGQSSLAGGGDADQGRATSPLPPSPEAPDFSKLSQEEASHALQALNEQQHLLLQQVKQQLGALRPPSPAQPANEQEATEARREEEKRQQLLQMLAEIERRIKQDNARPRKRYISPAVKEAVYAIYYTTLRNAIEKRGTDNFPQFGGKKLYGELTMVVTVNYDGRVVSTEIAESSGNRQLDRHAMAIAQSAGPFDAFSPPMRRQADQVVVVSRFKFTRDETLETSVAAEPRQ
ncbi:MAG: hypothetical protein RIR79_2114 [Pseudomonadota bacterium]|jgi:protein TonB